MKRFILLLVAGIFLAGCGGPLVFSPPESLLYQDQEKVVHKTVGIYIAPETKMKKFEPCEKLMFGSTQCYTGDIGKVLETNAVAAYSKAFDKVVILNSPDDTGGVDVAVQIGYKKVELKTTLDGVMAYRDVVVAIEMKQLSSGKDPVVFSFETKCKAWKCRVEGADKGMSGSEVVLKQLFLPGFVFSGYGKAMANIVNTAFCASLKEVLQNSVISLQKSM